MSRPLVYFVDDDESLMRAHRLLLSEAGMRVETFVEQEELFGQLEYDEGDDEPMCIVLDLRWDREGEVNALEGLNILKKVKASGCEAPIVVLTAHGDLDSCCAAFRNGAYHFLAKRAEPNELIEVVKNAVKDYQDQRARKMHARQLLEKLSDRELQTMVWTAEGVPHTEIAERIGVSSQSVSRYHSDALAKLEVASDIEFACRVLGIALSDLLGDFRHISQSTQMDEGIAVAK